MRYVYSTRRPRISEREKVDVENRVRFYRKMNEWSQEELAQKIGGHAGMIYQIEKGVVAPKITTVFKLAEVFEIDPMHLFFKPGENPPVKFNENMMK